MNTGEAPLICNQPLRRSQTVSGISRITQHAQYAVYNGIPNVNWVLDADIRGFFDTLNHDWRDSNIRGLTSGLTVGPQAGAQCVSSARWDLSGVGRSLHRRRAVLTATGWDEQVQPEPLAR